MKKIGVVLTLVMAFCCLTTSSVQADPLQAGQAAAYMNNSLKAAALPVWKITQYGTVNSVPWVNATNPRFGIYDAGTPGDETDDVVLDKETGLVWQRDPPGGQSTWFDALLYCHNLNLAGRMGWRMPTVEELSSLVDESQSPPKLPAGHPFLGVYAGWHWSCTTNASDSNSAYVVNLFSAAVFSINKLIGSQGLLADVWAVRGGPGHDGY